MSDFRSCQDHMERLDNLQLGYESPFISIVRFFPHVSKIEVFNFLNVDGNVTQSLRVLNIGLGFLSQQWGRMQWMERTATLS